MKPFVWYRGATFRMAAQVAEGTVTGGEPVRCALKKQKFGSPFGNEVLEFEASFVAAVDREPARWDFVGSPEDSLGLAAGQYVADARFEISGDVVITSTIPIMLQETVTTE